MEFQEHVAVAEGDTGDKTDIRTVPKFVLKRFIEVYRAHPALWQLKNKDIYGDKSLKYKGHQALMQVWRKYDPDADIEMVKSKIQSIRGSFRKELKKVHNSMKSGTEKIYKPKLWYFGMLQFLSDHEIPTERVNNDLAGVSTHFLKNEDISEESEQEITPTGLPRTSHGAKQQPRKKSRRLSEADERTTLLAACSNALKSSEKHVTEEEAFGIFVSKKMEKVKDECQRMFAEQLITKTLNYAIMGKLNEDVDVKLVPR